MSSLENYYTSTDLLNASIYATRRALMNKCKNKEMQKLMPGIGWVPDKRLQDISCPLGLNDCQEVAGRCKFLSKDSCLSQSGDYKNMGQGSKPYLEWNKEKCILGNFALRDWCENPHSRRAGEFVAGVTNTPPFKYDKETGRCLMTKPYCKYMGLDFTDVNSDFYKETGIAVPDCHQSKLQEIVEKYITGKTLFRGFKRGLFTKFLEDLGKSSIQPLGYYTLLQKAVDGDLEDELGLNKDYTGITEEFKQKVVEEFTHTGDTGDNKKDITVVGVCDPSAMKTKHIIGPNFGGEGIHLYFIEWNEDYLKGKTQRSVTYGFLCDELKKKYPHLIQDENGKKVIKINTKDVLSDLSLKRIYMIYHRADWYYALLSNFLMNSKLASFLLQKSGK